MLDTGPTSHGFISQRLRLNYVDWGNAGAPLLILVHGNRDHCRSWDWVAHELKDDWHVIAPDLRGHGDSMWVNDGNYHITDLVYDLAQLVRQLTDQPVTLVGHSLGANVSLRYTGLYPDKVRKLVAIEGLGYSPTMMIERAKISGADRFREWIGKKHAASARPPRAYPTLEAALARMKEANGFLSDEQARHLTIHGMNRNEDGSWSWKFDNYLHVMPFQDTPHADSEALWQAITCPTLLVNGAESWASNPAEDGRARYFRDVRVLNIPGAGHWAHHDQFPVFMTGLRGFL